MNKVEDRFRSLAAGVDYANLRIHDRTDDALQVRRGVRQPAYRQRNHGMMLTVYHKGGTGYCASTDVSPAGVEAAFREASSWAKTVVGKTVCDFSKVDLPAPRGQYAGPCERRWGDVSPRDKWDALSALDASMNGDNVASRSAEIWNVAERRTLLTSRDGKIEHELAVIVPYAEVTVFDGKTSQTRSNGRNGFQGGLEVLEREGFYDLGKTLLAEARELLTAPLCPTGEFDLLLAPDQMILQIHESIGHPIELDRILGDERNYAGTSFVTLDMFGKFQYGSPLLNIVFDPEESGEIASYAFDDDGEPAKREYLIRDGVLMRPLGGRISQFRAGGIAGVANSRACAWNRPAIDRMANVNMVPGTHSLQDMIAAIEDGVYMKANNSWSIDDSRNKFQFGCEWAQRIRGGKLAEIVRNPSYRGVSSSFWRSLRMVGDRSTFEVLGTPYCGKGEPNQAVMVGHATPAAVFSGVDVFGGVR